MESHPFPPFLPADARLLMLGTFPPAEKRWAMRFYYPNFTNDMWRIVGTCFFDDPLHFVRQDEKTYNQEALESFLREKGIALYDTCTKVIRTTGTASDKDLQVVEETDIAGMLHRLPQCRALVTAGQLATSIACRQLRVAEPKVGEYTEFILDNRCLRLYRMPSSSRAYPAPLSQKAAAYGRVFSLLTKSVSLFLLFNSLIV